LITLDGSPTSGATSEPTERVSYHPRLARVRVKSDPVGVLDQFHPLAPGTFVLKSNPAFIVAMDLEPLSCRRLPADARLFDL